MGGDYRYPDRGDAIQNRFLSLMSRAYADYYDASEKAVLERARRALAGGAADRTLLDAGTGTGRLLPAFAPHFRRVTAIEPDPERRAEARSLAQQAGFVARVSFHGSGIESFETEKRFDAILCSHVIQHVHTARVPRILAKLRDLLSPGGRIALTTCHSTVGVSFFEVTDVGDQPNNHQVPEAVFNAVAEQNDPTRSISQAFPRQKIEQLLSEAGLRPVEFLSYHVDDVRFASLGFDRLSNPDEHVNSDPKLQDGLGLDLYVLAERAG